MKICKNCYKVFSDDMNFCTECGTPLVNFDEKVNYTTTRRPSKDVEELSMTEAIQKCFMKYAVFKGIASSSEYGKFTLFNYIVYFVLLIPTLIFISDHLGNSSMCDLMLKTWYILFIYLLITYIPSLAVTVRRLHDKHASRGIVFLILIPTLGLLPLLFVVLVSF